MKLPTYSQILSPEITDEKGNKCKMYLGHLIPRPRDPKVPIVIGAKAPSGGHFSMPKEEKKEYSEEYPKKKPKKTYKEDE